MQTIKNDEVTDFQQGEPDELSSRLSDKIQSGDADGGTIGNMPEKGREVEINGLKFSVQQVTKSGNVVLEPKGK